MCLTLRPLVSISTQTFRKLGEGRAQQLNHHLPHCSPSLSVNPSCFPSLPAHLGKSRFLGPVVSWEDQASALHVLTIASIWGIGGVNQQMDDPILSLAPSLPLSLSPSFSLSLSHPSSLPPSLFSVSLPLR